jgi:hypothetical protein
MRNIKNLFAVTLLIIGLVSCGKAKKTELEEKQFKLILEQNGHWLVNLFAIDGGDSTKQHFLEYDQDYKNCDVRFMRKAIKKGFLNSIQMSSESGYYSFSDNKSQLLFHDVSQNCPSATIYKPGKIHNIFLLIPHEDTPWNIVTLTSDEFVLSCTYKKNYLVKLIRREAGTN